MIVTLKHKGLRLFFETGNASKIKQDHAKRLRFLLIKLDSAEAIKDMGFSGSDLHFLKGDRNKFWSVSINGNWRLIFRFEKGDAYEVDYKDYH